MYKNLIEVESLSKKFGASFALRDISLQVKEREIFGIVGMSGAGKSTLMRCLIGLERPTSGRVIIEGENISGLTPRDLLHFRKRIGMIFQHFNLFPSRTVAQNIAFPMEIHGIGTEEQEKRIDELLELIGLTAKKHAYPSRLSGGEKQRVGIARAIANKPDILFCDEATSALDPSSTRSIVELLHTLNRTQGLTLVVITHQLDIVKQLCTKVAVLSGGELIEQGPVTEVFVDPRHPITRRLLHPLAEQLPPEFLHHFDPNRRLVSLGFQGEKAKEPIITRLIKGYDIEVNILLGGLDCFQKTVIGTLVVELSGSPEELERALLFLKDNHVKCEVLQ